jgi:hypothetical protein
MGEMYQLVRDVCHQKISKGAAESLLVKKNRSVEQPQYICNK